MKWIKKGRAQVAQMGAYEAEIVKARGIYWATCYELHGSVKIKMFVFPPKSRIKALKELVESNAYFCKQRREPKQTRQQTATEPLELELEWWQR